MDIPDVVEQFRSAAIEKGDFADPSRDHALYETLKELFLRLIGGGLPGRAAVVALLDDESPHVRLWVAAQLAAKGNARAREVLQSLSNAPGMLGFRAGTTLKELEAGRLKAWQ